MSARKARTPIPRARNYSSSRVRTTPTRRDRGRHTTLQQIPDDGFLGRLEAAEFTGLSVQTLDAMIHHGDLRAFRVGRRVLVRKRDLVQAVTATEL